MHQPAATDRVRRALPLLCLLPTLAVRAGTPSIWDLQEVDAQGLGTHPLVGADPGNPANRVVIEGIALNAPGELLDPAQMWQLYVQAEAPDRGAIAAWAGVFYNDQWPKYPADIQPGDRVRIEGFIANHRGKVNINERHSPAPQLAFTVTVLNPGVGMPAPILIPAIADAVAFDSTRVSGPELYQSQWCILRGVRILDGAWAPGETLTITDHSGATLPMLLSSRGDFTPGGAPAGAFDVVGIFDQEDLEPPFTEGYRLWVKSQAAVQPAEPAAATIHPAVEIRWASAAGTIYQVVRSDDLANWEPVGGPVAGTGAEMSVFDSTRGETRAFYEVRVVPPPQ